MKAARALAGLSQIDLARAAGVNVTTISAMERKGATSLTSGVDTALKIALALEGSGVELMAAGGRPGVRLKEAAESDFSRRALVPQKA